MPCADRRLAVPLLLAAIGPAGCDEQAGGYLPVSRIAPNGFLSEEVVLAAARGQQIRLWGFIDQGNLYGDAGAKAILQDLWSGTGADDVTWRFNLKGAADDPMGHSFAVHVPNDAGRDALLEAFVSDARAGRPIRVFVKGRIVTFDAQTNAGTRTGLCMKLQSSRDILLGD